jgi:HlyD family secretion protein
VVVSKLLVDKGDHVKAGQVIAVLDQLELREAGVDRARAELANAEAELRRNAELRRSDVISVARQETADLRVQLARAALREAEVSLERMRVRSPIDGQVIQVFAREGERVGPDGIVELGSTQNMYAIAEVYETDIGRVRLGQRATVKSRALPRGFEGTVVRIGLKIAKLDSLGTDPAARTDARVVEVEIRLDEAEAVAGLTNLQVEIVIRP